jgi:ferritin-like metal-binding protein YciE
VADKLNQRDAKLVEWLGEAHTKEAELEADLTVHIRLTQKDSYKKRLKQHLAETREHKRQVARRIKALGGSVSANPAGGGVGKVVSEAAGKAVALVKGQVGAARAAATEQAETHLRNAQEELREEQVEIAMYKRIETFATAVGDDETAKLARTVRREEERMARYLDAELERLVKEYVKAEVPREQRAAARSGARRTARAGRSGGASAQRTSARAGS